MRSRGLSLNHRRIWIGSRLSVLLCDWFLLKGTILLLGFKSKVNRSFLSCHLYRTYFHLVSLCWNSSLFLFLLNNTWFWMVLMSLLDCSKVNRKEITEKIKKRERNSDAGAMCFSSGRRKCPVLPQILETILNYLV